ncbi:MAG: pre-peptidase C-terminal domain-containing protein [Deltaproteobacteria bacterium]|nr:pre-peptidase C-terminal domain-containing protein [Deltaproteobacteria bacterium]
MRSSLSFAALSCLSLASIVACSSSNGGSAPTATADAAAETATTTADAKGDASLDTKTAGDTGSVGTGDAKADGGTDLPKVDTKKDTAPPADDKMEGATMLDPAAPAEDDLVPTDDVDWYWFEGKKGDLVILSIEAQSKGGAGAAFAADSIDTVLTVYGPDKQIYAFNDDPVPRDNNDSQLYTVLPADGKYWVKVEECNTWVATATNVPQGASCAKPFDKNMTNYTLYFAVLDPAKAAVVQDSEKGNDDKAANEVVYKKNQQGNYIAPLLYGFFTDASDTDVFLFKLPAEIPVAEGKRLSASIEGFVGGPLGNGSTTSPGMVGLSSAATPAQWIALSDFSNDAADLSVPVTADAGYLLYVPHKGDKKGANDFYILVHSFGPGNPVEQKDADNNAAATAEVLTSQQKDGLPKYFVEGNLTDKDVDHYAFSVDGLPATATKIAVACAAQLDGSGIRGLSAELLDKDGKAFAFAAETDKVTLQIKNTTDIPKGSKNLVLKLSFDKQDPKVSGNYYRCGIHISEPQAN